MRAPPLTPLVKILLVGLFGAFVVQVILNETGFVDPIGLLSIHAGDGLGVFLLWQVFTHVIVQGITSTDLVGLLFTLVFLWWMGSPFEARFGANGLLKLLAVATLSAGVFAIVATTFLGGVVAGSMPWLSALIAGYAATIPKGAQLSLFGVVPMKRNTLLGLLVAWVVASSLVNGLWASMIANLAAIACAWYWMKWRIAPRRPKAPKRRKKNGGSSGRFQVIKGGLDDDDDDDDRPKYLN